MMENRPFKFRLLELFIEQADWWNYDITRKMQEDYNLPKQYDRDVFNYELLEMSASGFIVMTDAREDSEGLFRKGTILCKYEVTNIGRAQFKELCGKIKPRGE